MRFEKVTAYAFGPLRDAILEFAPGMNVIYGPNEAGKSSWHAALYAGLCGIRKGRGKPKKEDTAFERRHRPWEENEWEVGVIVARENGRRVELRHNLSLKSGSAQDLDLAGCDYSSDIIHDGAPDGSLWLGLHRRIFLHTACVRQRDILDVRADPESLQDDMQKAAATARAGETAAAALQLLRVFLKEKVGSPMAPTKPLKTTELQVAKARTALDEAREEQRDHLHRCEIIEGEERAVKREERKIAAMDAVFADREARASESRIEKAQALADQFPDGSPHPSPGDGGVLLRVTEALATWSRRPAHVELTGPSARELTERIDRARHRRRAARTVVAEEKASRVAFRVKRAEKLDTLFPKGDPRITSAEEARERETRDVLHAWHLLRPKLQKPQGTIVEILRQRREDINRKREKISAGSRKRLIAGRAAWGVLFAGIGVSLLLPDLRLAGIVAAVVGALVLLACRTASSRSRRVESELDIQWDAVGRDIASRDDEDARYERARNEETKLIKQMARLADCDGEAASEPKTVVGELRDWLTMWSADKDARIKLGPKWDEFKGLLGGSSLEDLVASAEHLRTKADDLAESVDESLLEEMRSVRISEDDLADIERVTDNQTERWTRERAAREMQEELHDKNTELIAAAEETLRAAAQRAGVAGDDPGGLAERLTAWKKRQERHLKETEQRNASLAELQRLLRGQTLEEFSRNVEQLRDRADRLANEVGPEALAEAREMDWSPEYLEERRRDADDARSNVDKERHVLAELEQHLPNVADAEDALAEAEREHDRVVRLKGTLDKTIAFLEDAQERVLLDIAPVLKSTILEWLPRVTGGRYTDCRVNPESLLVEVRAGEGGDWQAADLLSQGTVEQVYLLLRLALCRHLVKRGERCPLILDDVLAASDSERKVAVLDTLRALGESTQVILFTHDDDARQWARDNLREPQGKLIELAGPQRDDVGRHASLSVEALTQSQPPRLPP